MMKNMSQFENYLHNIHHKFTFIVLSETWINEGTADLFSINGYLCEHKFHNLVKTTDWIFVSLESSSQASFSLFHKKLLEYFNACFPIKHVRLHYRNRKCWLSDTLKRFIIKKNKAYLLFKKCPNVTNEVLYKQYRSKVNSEMRLAERKYYQNRLENNKFNLKKIWQMLKDIIGKSKPDNMSIKFLLNGTIVEDSKVIANAFNDFYINIGSNSAGKLSLYKSDKLYKN